jgi:hypothetical protein
MILQLSDYKRFLPPNTITDQTKFDAFETRALYRYFPHYMGGFLVETLASGEGDEDLISRVAPALANLTYLLSIPFFNVLLTSSGFGVVSNPNVAPASMERIRDLKEACLQGANDGIDSLLAFLEENKESYTSWNGSSLNPGSLIKSSIEFSAAIGLNVPRYQFVDLKEHILRIETTRMAAVFSKAFCDEMNLSTDTVVRPLMVKALANLAWRSFQDAGRDAGNAVSSPFYSFEDFAMQYIGRALSLLKANASSYPTWLTNGYEAPYENSDENNLDGGFFIGGITA